MVKNNYKLKNRLLFWLGYSMLLIGVPFFFVISPFYNFIILPDFLNVISGFGLIMVGGILMIDNSKMIILNKRERR